MNGERKKMTHQRMLELLNIERACVASDCPEKTAGCSGCHLAQDQNEIIEALDMAIRKLDQTCLGCWYFNRGDNPDFRDGECMITGRLIVKPATFGCLLWNKKA